MAYESLIDDAKFNQISQTLIDDDHLLYRIDEANEDAVFTRSFSALALSTILHNHNERNYLSNEVQSDVIDKVKLYMSKEKDYRGFVTNKGWAHSAAHVADVIGCFTANEQISFDKNMDLLSDFKDMFLSNTEVFTHNEDERIVSAFIILFKRLDFNEARVIEWIESIDKSKFVDSYPEDMYTRINSKLLLRSLYFKLSDIENTEKIKAAIKTQLALF